MKSKWYVYMIESRKGKIYTGISTDYERRFFEHLTGVGGAKFFRSNPPERIVYMEDALSRSDASKREAEIKKMSRKEKLDLIGDLVDH